MKKRILALFLCVILVITSQGISALAYTVRDSAGNVIPTAGDSEDKPVIKTQNGDVLYDESWETIYPYGTFAFGNYQADVAEGGPAEADGINIPSRIIMPVYRVGGTTGKVTAKIVYTPAIAQSDTDGTINYDFAASGTKDIRISYENPLSIAANQPIGRAPIFADEAGTVMVYPKNEDEIWKLNDHPDAIEDWILSASGLGITGDEVVYKWQVGSDFVTVDGINYATVWTDIMDSNTLSIELKNTDIWEIGSRTWKNDYRLVYSVDGVLYSPKSLMNVFGEDVSAPVQFDKEETPAPVLGPEQSAEFVGEDAEVIEESTEEAVIEAAQGEENTEAAETEAEENTEAAEKENAEVAEEENTEAAEEENAEAAAEEGNIETAEETNEAVTAEAAEESAETEAEENTEAAEEENTEAAEEENAEAAEEENAEAAAAEEYIPEFNGDLAIDEEITYSTIDFGEEFDSYEFEITFAENEWIKNIIIEAVDDDIRELNELGLFTITGCIGGEISSICNTCTVMVTDNEAKEASEIGFEVTDICCDQDAGFAELVIKRVGDTTYNVAVDYATADGTAVAGKQYTETKGTVSFVGSADEFTVKIPLIAEDVRPEELDFKVVLSNLKGGMDGLCLVPEDKSAATVRLSSTGALWDMESGLNLSSILARTGADEVSGNGYFEGGSLVPAAGKATGEYYSLPRENLVGEYNNTNSVDLQSYTYTGTDAVTFSRSNYGANMWRDYGVVVGDSSEVPADSTRISYTFLYPGYKPTGDKQNGDRTETIKDDNGIQMIHYAHTFKDATEKGNETGRTNMQINVGNAGDYYSSVIYNYFYNTVAIAKAGEKYDNRRYVLPITKLYQKKYMNNESQKVVSQHYMTVTDTGVIADHGGSRSFSGEMKLQQFSDVDKQADNFIAQTSFIVATNKEYDQDHDRRTNGNAVYELDYMYLKRRKFAQTGIGLRIYTANDSDTLNGFIGSGIANENYSVLDPKSSVYSSIKPSISIVDGAGGVDASGHLYAGSQLLVSLSNSAVYTLAKDVNNKATYSVYVTDDSGKICGTVEQVSGNDKQYKISLYWDGMTDAELSKNYTINIVMKRQQDIILDIEPSIQKDDSGKYTDSDTADVWAMLTQGRTTEVSYGAAFDIAADNTSYGTHAANRFMAAQFSEGWNVINSAHNTTGLTDTQVNLKTLIDMSMDNLYWINLGQDAEDIILFNGRSYAGNEDIYLTMADLSLAKLIFHFYDSTVLENVSPIRTTIDHIELYFDANGDGVISGSYDSSTGYFTVDSSKDILIQGNVTESFADNMYRPKVGADGKLYQYFFKVYYSANPRSLHKPADDKDEPDTAWIVPFFTSSTTQAEIRASQTNEQNSYRFINATNLSGHPVYGSEITKITYTDIPLGGDSAIITSNTVTTGVADSQMKLQNTETSTVYEWIPAYHGNLMFTYTKPAMISFDQNVTNTPIALTETDEINEYLGSFADNTIMGLSVKRGNKADFGSEIADDSKPESYSLGDIKAVRPSLNALQTEGNTNNQQSAEAKEPEGVNDYSEYSADLGVELPSLEFEMGDYFNITMDGYTLALSIGIPVYSKENTKYSGGQQEADEKASNVSGAKTIERTTTEGEDTTKETVTYKDAGGNKLGEEEVQYGKPKKTTFEDGSSMTTTDSTAEYTPATDSQKPVKKQVTNTQVIELKDKDGNLVSRKTIKETYDVDEKGNKSNKRYSQTFYEQDGKGGYKYTDEDNKEIKVTGYVAPSAAPTQAAAGSPTPTRRASTENFIAANEALGAVGQFFKGVTDKIKNGKNSKEKTGIKDLLTSDESLKQAKGVSPKATSKSFELSVKVQLAIAFEYNPINDEWCFKQAAVSASLGIEFTIKYRLTPCPIVYVYIKFGVEVEISLGLSVDKVAKSDDKILTNKVTSQKNISFDILVDKSDKNGGRGFSAKFNGCIRMDVYENYGKEGQKLLTKGLIRGDGENATEVFFQNYKKTVTVVLSCQDDLDAEAVKELTGIKGAKSEVHFDGVSVNPSFSIEAGAGVGVECCNVEVCIRVNLSIELVFGGYAEGENGESGYTGAYMSAFDFSISLGINVTFLFFNFSMDAIGVRVHGEQDPFNASHTTWTTTVFALNDWIEPLYENTVEYHSLNEESGNSTAGMIRKSGPVDLSDSIRFAKVNNGSAADPLAYNPTDDKAPFQLSGYNTSGDAKMLVEGLTTGYNYKLFSVGEDNYILYPISERAEGTDITVTHLVLSKLVLEGNTEAESDHTMVGVQNPVDPSNSVPYIYVDNDEASDTEFAVDVDGKVITVAWTGYAAVEELAKASEAATKLVVKRAGINLETDSEFSTPELVSTDWQLEVYRSLPVQVGEYTIYAQAADTDSSQTNALLKQYLAKKYNVTESEFTSGVPTTPDSVSVLYNWVTRSEMNSLYGSHSNLMLQKSAISPAAFNWNGSGHEVIENIDATDFNDSILVTYTTSETAYMAKSSATGEYVNITDPDEITADTEQATIRRMYIGTCDKTSGDWQEAKLVHTVVDFDSCNYENMADCELKDGLYIGTNLKSGTDMADPLFSNVKFIKAKLNGTTQETILLYEMGGNTYIIDEQNLENILSGTEEFSIKQVFSETTGTNVNINTDADGAMALVYTAPVKGTSNNAIYVAYWDAAIGENGGFGSANILAMNHLQVYEDSQKIGLSDEDLEKAFLGIETENAEYEKLKSSYSDQRNKGAMDTLVFGNLQMTTRTVGTGENTSKQLVVLTEGSMIDLVSKTMKYTQDGEEHTQTVYVQDQGTSENPKYPEVGFYAIAFGEGEQAIGEGNIDFEFYSFASDDVLRGVASFTNTGTTAIRGSEKNPITVTLTANGQGYSQTLATGYIHENIPAGCKGELKFVSNELTQTLPVGTTFTLSVSEDADYIEESGGTPFSEQLEDLFTVEAKPDLSFDSAEFEVVGIDTSVKGDERAIVEFSTYVRNIGVEDADHVFVQMTYDTGEVDKFGAPVYKCIDLRRSKIETTEQQAISFQAVSSPTSDNLQYGIVALKSTKDTGTDVQRIKSGYERLVSGQLYIPLSCFVSTEDVSGLHLRAEIFSDSDNLSYDDSTKLYSSSHEGEYRGTNNIMDKTISHRTIFTAPAQISMALGNTMYIPVSPKSTYVDGDIIATEIIKGDEKAKLGVLYYDAKMKAIVVAPGGDCENLLAQNIVPEGIIEIQDKSTNSQYSIAFKVTALGTGVNIFNDDQSFVFKNANGTVTDPDADNAHRDWSFSTEIAVWMVEGNSKRVTPMNNDYVVAIREGASISFASVANEIKVYYSGQISVSSSDFGSATAPEASAPDSSYTFRFAKNTNGETHTITIKALTGNTIIDRYEAKYASGTNPIPDVDEDKPSVYYSRSFPNPASINQKNNTTGVTFKAYIIDAGGLASVSWNGVPVDNAIVSADGTFWKFDINIKKNGTYKLIARDKSGNETISTIEASWFNTVVSANAIADAPSLSESNIVMQKANGSAVGTIESSAPYLKVNTTVNDTEELVVRSSISGNFAAGTTLEAESDGRWKMEQNGYYLVQKNDTGNNTWAQAVVQMNILKLEGPTLSAMITEDGSLVIEATDSLGIKALTVNDWEVPQAVGSKRVNLTYRNVLGGEYRIVVRDQAGTGEASDTVHSKIAVLNADSTIRVNEAEISVSPDGIISFGDGVLSGGYYGSDCKGKSLDEYKGNYCYTVVEAVSQAAVEVMNVTDEEFESFSSSKTIAADHASSYALIFRDADLSEASQAVSIVKVGVSLNIPGDAVVTDSDAVIHVKGDRISGGYFNETINRAGTYVDSAGYDLTYYAALTEAADIASVSAGDFKAVTNGSISFKVDHAAKYALVFRLEADSEAGQEVRMCDSIYIITDNSTSKVSVESDSPDYVGPDGSYSFKLATRGTVSNSRNAVYANGIEITPDDNGIYVIDNIHSDQFIDVSRIVLVSPKSEEAPSEEETESKEKKPVVVTTGSAITVSEANAKVKIVTMGSENETGTATYVKPADGSVSNVTIPGSVEINGITYKITRVGRNAFRNNQSVESIKMSSNITVIGKNAFRNCNNLTKVVIGKGVTTIGTGAFIGCDRLTDVTIGKNVTKINSHAFYRCRTLEKIVIPASVTTIGSKAFAGCYCLKDITILSTKIKAANVGRSVFKNIFKKAVISIPKKKEKPYTEWIKDSVTSSKIKIVTE